MRISVLSVSRVIWTDMIWSTHIVCMRLRGRRYSKDKNYLNSKHN